MIVAIYRTVLISHSILSAVCCPVLLAGLWELWNILSVMINCPASETEVKWWDRELKMALLLSVALGFLFLHQARTTGQGIVSLGRPSGQNDWSRHCVLGSSVRLLPNLTWYFENKCTSFGAYWNKRSMKQQHETMDLAVRRAEVEVTQGWDRSQKSIPARFLKNYPRNFNETRHAHITVNTSCVVTTCHMRCRRSRSHDAEDTVCPKKWDSCNLEYLVQL